MAINCFTRRLSSSLASITMVLVRSSATMVSVFWGAPFLVVFGGLKIVLSKLTSLDASAYSSGITDISCPIPVMSIAPKIRIKRLMLEYTSVRINVFVGEYARRTLLLDTIGVNSRLISTTFAYFKGMSWVTILSSDSRASCSRRVSTFFERASGAGIIFTTSPDCTVVYPWTSRTDSKTL